MIKFNTSWIVLLLLALTASIALQAYFVSNEYRIRTIDFERAANEIFEQAVKEEKTARLDSLMIWFETTLQDSSEVILSASYDTLEQKTRYSIQDTEEEDPYTNILIDIDSMKVNELTSENYNKAVNFFVRTARNWIDEGRFYYWTKKLGEQTIDLANQLQPDTTYLKDLYQQKLKARGWEAPFYFVLSADELNDQDTSSAFMTLFIDNHLNNEKGNQSVAAIFPNPSSVILKSASWSIFSAFLIILLTGGLFFIMYRNLAQQKALHKIKDDFIDNMTHELQTPIATLKAANESMERYDILKDQAKADRYILISKQAIQRLSQMVDQALLNSIYDRKNEGLKQEELDLNLTLQEVIDQVRLKAPQVQFEVYNQYPKTMVRVDNLHFKNILFNLVENAVKHNQDQAPLTVKLALAQGDDQGLKVVVEDNGKGIPKAALGNIFTKFYRLDDRSSKGFGIGLYYVKKMIERMGGSIQVDSTLNQGSIFTLQIPQ